MNEELQLARECVARHQWSDALRQCRAVLANEPYNGEALTFFTHAAIQLGQPQEVVALSRSLVRSAPETSDIYQLAGTLVFAAGDAETAAGYFVRALELVFRQ